MWLRSGNGKTVRVWDVEIRGEKSEKRTLLLVFHCFLSGWWKTLGRGIVSTVALLFVYKEIVHTDKFSV